MELELFFCVRRSISRTPQQLHHPIRYRDQVGGGEKDRFLRRSTATFLNPHDRALGGGNQFPFTVDDDRMNILEVIRLPVNPVYHRFQRRQDLSIQSRPDFVAQSFPIDDFFDPADPVIVVRSMGRITDQSCCCFRRIVRLTITHTVPCPAETAVNKSISSPVRNRRPQLRHGFTDRFTVVKTQEYGNQYANKICQHQYQQDDLPFQVHFFSHFFIPYFLSLVFIQLFNHFNTKKIRLNIFL